MSCFERGSSPPEIRQLDMPDPNPATETTGRSMEKILRNIAVGIGVALLGVLAAKPRNQRVWVVPRSMTRATKCRMSICHSRIYPKSTEELVSRTMISECLELVDQTSVISRRSLRNFGAIADRFNRLSLIGRQAG